MQCSYYLQISQMGDAERGYLVPPMCDGSRHILFEIMSQNCTTIYGSVTTLHNITYQHKKFIFGI